MDTKSVEDWTLHPATEIPITRVTEYRIGTAASFGLDVGRPDHLAPLFGLVGDKLTEVGGRAWKHCATKVGKPRLDFGIGEARVDLRVELVANASTLGVLCWKSSRENIVSTANFLGR